MTVPAKALPAIPVMFGPAGTTTRLRAFLAVVSAGFRPGGTGI